MTPRILIVDDDDQMRIALSATIKHLGFEPTAASGAKEALKLLKNNQYNVIISDLKMPKMDGIEFLREVKKLSDTPFIMITAVGTVESAVEAMKIGAFDFILKPFSQETLEKAIKLAMSHKQLTRKLPETPETSQIVCESELTKRIFALAEKVANTDATVLLLGESGVGKEVVAKFIHRLSPRQNKPFIALNCAAIPENLLEAEMFGYEKGAFSGAIKSHKGKFEQAHKGTLLLDEITEMPQTLQAKLLRVIQEKTIDRIGSEKPIEVDVRIICTTNKDVRKEMEEGRFREDLYYRINVFPINIPPLRERREEIEPLALHFLRIYSSKFNKPIKNISPEAIKVLKGYPWPGNVRELENAIERACVLCDSDTVTPSDIFLHT